MEESKLPKGEQSRGRLLAAAASEFAAKGFHRARVSDIVKAAGLTQASFYQYFESKEGLYQQLMDEFFSRLWELADGGSKVTALGKADVFDQVRENLVALFGFFQERPELTQIVLYQAEAGEELHRKLAAMVSANLRQNQVAGHVRAALSPEVAAEAMVAVCYADGPLFADRGKAARAARRRSRMLFGARNFAGKAMRRMAHG